MLALRRKTVAVVGAVALLALSGSQSVAPVRLAFEKADPGPAEPLEGEAFYYDAAWSQAPVVVDSGSTATGTTLTGTALATGETTSTTSGPKPFGFNTPATFTSSGIPEPAYRAYVNAAQELAVSDPSCKISWSLIAGIGRVESNHGRYGGSSISPSGLVSPPILGVLLDGSRAGMARISDSDNGRYDGNTAFDRAVGPMQFLPGTWKMYGGGADPQDMNAAALATGKYLCSGSGSLDNQPGRWAAVYRYNHSDSYVSLVLSLADSYASGHVTTFPSRPAGTTTPEADTPAATPAGPPPSLPPVPPVTTTPASNSPITIALGTPPTMPAKIPTRTPTSSGTVAPPATTPPATTPTATTLPPTPTTAAPTSTTAPTTAPAPTTVTTTTTTTTAPTTAPATTVRATPTTAPATTAAPPTSKPASPSIAAATATATATATHASTMTTTSTIR